MLYALVAAICIMLASLSGIFFVWKNTEKWMRRNLRYLITFAAGVFFVVSYNLFAESIEHDVALFTLLIVASLGALSLEVVSRIVPKSHHHHGVDHRHTHNKLDARRLLLGDSIHNAIDGVLLVSAFIIDVRFGIGVACAIFLHEVVQGISEFFVLREAGFSAGTALVLNFIVNATILLGVVGGSLIASAELFVPLLTAFAAGSFVFVVTRDLLPSTFRDVSRNKNAPRHLLAGMLGVALMFSIGVLVPDAHANATIPTVLSSLLA